MMTESNSLGFKDMCERFEVTPRTLRYYEYIELLSPRREGRSRFYGPREIARMTLILRGRRFGFSLEEIRQWLELYESHGTRNQYEVWIELADRQLGVLEGQIEDLIEVRRELRELRDESLAILTRMTGAD